jgi:LmbE family N-acetylglucosaminyl deacetylase
MLPDSEVSRALAIMAHPDDVDFSAAGLIAQWTAAGIEVTYCLVTDGDAGGFDQSIPRPEMAQIRRREQTAAAKLVGVDQLIFLGYPDGRVEANLDLRKALSRVIRQTRPDRVICQSALMNYERIYGSHPDHLAAGQASIAAIYPDSRNPFAYPELMADEQLEPWTVRETWVPIATNSNHSVDITSHMDLKIAALRAHASQHRDADGMEGRIRAWNRAQGEAAGFGPDSYAEVFLVIDTQ